MNQLIRDQKFRKRLAAFLDIKRSSDDQISGQSATSKVYQREKFMLSDTQVFLALFVSLITGVLAVRLGTQLYK